MKTPKRVYLLFNHNNDLLARFHTTEREAKGEAKYLGGFGGSYRVETYKLQPKPKARK